MVLFNLKVLAKFGLCSNCSQKLDGCSLARARKIFATACQMLVLAKINTLLACSQRPFYTRICIMVEIVPCQLNYCNYHSFDAFATLYCYRHANKAHFCCCCC